MRKLRNVLDGAQLAHQGPQTTSGRSVYDEAAAAATRARASSSCALLYVENCGLNLLPGT
jgi:hypothetical protein